MSCVVSAATALLFLVSIVRAELPAQLACTTSAPNGSNLVANMVASWQIELDGGRSVPSRVTMTNQLDGEVEAEGGPSHLHQASTKQVIDRPGRSWHIGTPNDVP